MDKTLGDLMTGLAGGDPSGIFGSIVDSMTNIAQSRYITLKEPDNVVEAIQMHDERIRMLRMIKEKGFSTIAEYNKYKEAQDLIAKHEQNMDTDEGSSD
jgi:hypothetical protein